MIQPIANILSRTKADTDNWLMFWLRYNVTGKPVFLGLYKKRNFCSFRVQTASNVKNYVISGTAAECLMLAL